MFGVQIQSMLSAETTLAEMALAAPSVPSHATVCSCVTFQVRRLRESLFTLGTGIGLLSCMNQNVGGQVSFGDERLTATLMWAIVRSLAGMDAQVSLQITCFLKLKHALRERAE